MVIEVKADEVQAMTLELWQWWVWTRLGVILSKAALG